MAGGDDTGLGAKRFAPVAAALEPGVPLDWTEAKPSERQLAYAQRDLDAKERDRAARVKAMREMAEASLAEKSESASPQKE